MLRSQIVEELQTVFRDVFMDDSIKIFDAMTATDIEEWDSLSHITLVVNIEKTFGVQLSAADVANLKNVGAMIDLLERLCKHS